MNVIDEEISYSTSLIINKGTAGHPDKSDFVCCTLVCYSGLIEDYSSSKERLSTCLAITLLSMESFRLIISTME